MKAVVLVGGEGTRLRPLTETTPKPLLPLMGRPFLHHVLDHLAVHGVHEVILSSPHLEETFGPFVAERLGDPKITWITEAEPLGTGGAVLNALDRLEDGTFFVLNGDILTDLDLTAMASEHRSRGAAVSIATMHVEDARPFGLVIADGERRVEEFREKPADRIPGDINAGTYLVEPGALDRFRRGEPASIERDIFPEVIAAGAAVFAFPSRCYWMDLGTPEKYLQAHFDILDGLLSFEEPCPAPWVSAGAEIDPAARLGRLVVALDGSSVAADAEVQNSVLMSGASVGPAATVAGSILGPRSRVGAAATVRECVLGAGAALQDGAVVTGEKIRATD